MSALAPKTLNPPFFGRQTKVRSVRQAIVLLGLLNTVAGLALRRSMQEFDGPAPEHYRDSP